jgi:hypothetical protein
MDRIRSSTTYRGYRIYEPLDDEFERDVYGNILIHVLIEAVETGLLENIPIKDVKAASVTGAKRKSVSEAIRVIQGRNGGPESSGKMGTRTDSSDRLE